MTESGKSVVTIALAAIVTAGMIGEAAGQRRGGGDGGFSRGGAAAQGGFSSGGGAARASQRQSSRSANQASRQQSMSENQSARQSTALQAQNTRANTATNLQNNRDDCYNCGRNWDSGSAAAGFVAGAVVGGAVVAAATPNTAVVVSSPPCNVAAVSVNGVAHYYCGSTWYAAGYANDGVVYVPTAAPPGY